MTTKKDGKKEDEVIAEKLFGSVNVQKQASGGALNTRDLDLLGNPLELEMGARVFCAPHHGIFSVSFFGRKELSRMAGVDDNKIDWNHHYIEVSACPFCAEDYRFKNPVVKNLKN